jgi:hypothetical protein
MGGAGVRRAGGPLAALLLLAVAAPAGARPEAARTGTTPHGTTPHGTTLHPTTPHGTTPAAGGAARAGAPGGEAVPPLAQVRRDLEFARFAAALTGAERRLEGASAEGPQGREERVELHRIAALAAAALREGPRADAHLRALLRLDPGHALDPFTVPPPVVARLEQLRAEMAPEFEALRREASVREAQRAEEQQQLARALAEAEQARRDTGWVGPALLWAPFGLGHLRQGRQTAGTALALAQGTLALASVTSFITWHAKLDDRRVQVVREGQPEERLEYGILPRFQERMRIWRLVNLASTAGFFALWLGSGVEANLHASRQDAPGPGAAPPSRAGEAPPPALAVLPLPDGAAASVTLRF